MSKLFDPTSSRSLDPDLSHLTSADYEQIYEPSEDTYLMFDALHSDAEWIRTTLKPNHSHGVENGTGLSVPICFEIGSGSGALITYLSILLKSLSISSLFY